MQVRIGVTYNPREIEIEMADDTDVDAIRQTIEKAVSDGQGLFWLTDRKGRQIGIVTDKLAWMELGSGADLGRIGFGAA